MKSETLRPSDPFGFQRIIHSSEAKSGGAKKPEETKVFPLEAGILDPSLPIAEDEVLVEVESIVLDSSAFRQLSEAFAGDVAKLQKEILSITEQRGKFHHVTSGGGGILMGRVVQVGPLFPGAGKNIQAGDRVATLNSLSLTPLKIRKIKNLQVQARRLDVEGHAILFASGSYTKIPQGLPETVVLAALEVAGVAPRTASLVAENHCVVVIGGGKAGVLALYEAKQKLGVRTVVVEIDETIAERLRRLTFIDEVICADARDGLAVSEAVWNVTKGRMGDLVIDTANQPGMEMAAVLSARRKGVVCFFNLATHFVRATSGAEGVGADIDLRMLNGFAEGHADLVTERLRDSGDLNRLFAELYS